MQRLIELINSEDKKNPYTDQELAGFLSIPRLKVIQMRNELNIPDSRDRRKELLLADLRDILQKNMSLSERKVTELMVKRGYNISRSIISKNIKEVIQEFKGENSCVIAEEENIIVSDESEDKSEEGFEKLIGYRGSLKNKIDLAKAAILYPPNGLHTLIYGGSGVGKSELAECMYEFATSSGAKPKNAPFIIFNCADYAENPNLLIAQLFGVIKGAYTGANADKEGLVERANGGILFLDEIHRLPSEGQEILFYLIDKGKYRRLGETNVEREVNVLILAATTENPESNLLLTFRRRIPMLIELPKLTERPLSERLEVIIMFLTREAQRINRNLLVTKEVLTCLMLYNCKANIGQLKSDIQVICAKGYVKYMFKNADEVVIDMEDVSISIKSTVLEGQKNSKQVRNLGIDDLYIDIRNEQKNKDEIKNYVNENEIYHYIEEQFKKLELEGIEEDEIDKVLLEKVENKLGKIIDNKKITKLLNINELKTIVRPEVISITEGILELVRGKYKFINNSFFIALAIHINFTIERVMTGKVLTKSNIHMDKNTMIQEMKIAEKIRLMIERATNLKIPKRETMYIAIYIKKFCSDVFNSEPKVRVIIITHGHVACGIADIVNQLLGVEDALGLEIALDESPEKGLERTIELVQASDEGRGCLLLVDMGSLGMFSSMVEERTGIKTRSLSRVDTLLALEAVRKASIEGANLDNIVEMLQAVKEYNGTFKSEINYKKNIKKKAIVTVCLTGEGSALSIKKYIEKHLEQQISNIEILAMGFINKRDIEDEIVKLSNEYDILAVCGTIRIKVDNIPFIDYESMLNGIGINKLIKLIETENDLNDEMIYGNLNSLVSEELMLLNLDCLSKEEAIDKMAELLEEKGFVNNKFMLNLYKRESMGNVVFNSEVAIPHGLPENVIKPAIVIAKLKKPIQWNQEIMVDIVFMLALKDDNREEIKKLFYLVREKNLVNRIRLSKSSEEIKKMFS
ncbi:PTS system transcriptional activator [Clostridium sp. DL-VIII]|uniref:sigma 54-interacting transcriptional regulator n=1 Tax=Clostridium sp. DL-VIII TaxID=641107 RepID=UPI00023AF453|nr:sigma 54-interacting transcriptional regulator [Clostridium sp. DL-VIII]EHI97230.1 PTS system transcriptional activator [Clostridium sp. DL-VIII]